MTQINSRLFGKIFLVLVFLGVGPVQCSSEDKGKTVVSKSRLQAGSTSSDVSEARIDPNTPPTSPPPGGAPNGALLALHEANKDSCIKCHEPNRPSADHFAGQDCVSCHKFPSFSGGLSGGDPSGGGGGGGGSDPLLALHETNKDSCIKCHEPHRPSPAHFAGQDCVSCHRYPSFKGGLSSGTPGGGQPGTGGDGLLALHEANKNSCVQCHETKRPNANHYPGKDCASCHKFPSFKGASFAHNPKPPRCEDCHARPAQVGRRAYPNQGPPANFNAADKTAAGSGHYVGKDCISCHSTPREGATTFSFSHTSPNPQACLPCHFNDGAEEHRNSARVMLTGFGNCQTCHQNFARPNRNFDAN